MLPIRRESDSWRASDLSTLPQGPSLNHPPAPLSGTPIFRHSPYRLLPFRSLVLAPFIIFPFVFFFKVGISPLQITDTKRGGAPAVPSLSAGGPEPPVSFNEPIKVYFSSVNALKSFLCDSWLGNVSVNLIKDSAVLIIFCQISHLMALRCIICIVDWSRVCPFFFRTMFVCWLKSTFLSFCTSFFFYHKECFTQCFKMTAMPKFIQERRTIFLNISKYIFNKHGTE